MARGRPLQLDRASSVPSRHPRLSEFGVPPRSTRHFGFSQPQGFFCPSYLDCLLSLTFLTRDAFGFRRCLRCALVFRSTGRLGLGISAEPPPSDSPRRPFVARPPHVQSVRLRRLRALSAPLPRGTPPQPPPFAALLQREPPRSPLVVRAARVRCVQLFRRFLRAAFLLCQARRFGLSEPPSFFGPRRLGGRSPLALLARGVFSFRRLLLTKAGWPIAARCCVSFRTSVSKRV